MDRIDIDNDHVVARYVAGQLSEAEEAAFDEYASGHPEIYRDVDNIFRLKEGLQSLRNGGELPELLQERRWKPEFGVGTAAAAVVLAILAVWIWQRDAGPPDAVLARSLTEFAVGGARPLRIAARYVLVRSRGPTAELEIRRPPFRAAIEVQIMPSSYSKDDRYQVVLRRESSPYAESKLNGLAAASDRYVTVYLDSLALTPGEYELSMRGQAFGEGEYDRFVLLVK